MAAARQAFVHEARLQLEAGTDAGAPGAAVTTALCGHWEHEGPCRWPHNNDLEVATNGATFRTLFVAAGDDEDEVRTRIVQALEGGVGWAVLHSQRRPVAPPEQRLAERLAGTPAT